VTGVETRIEVNGLAEALRTLQKVDPELRKETIKGMKAAATPLEAAARSLVPNQSPLRNWGTWRGGWDYGAVTKGIKVAFRGGKVRGYAGDVFPLLTLRQVNAAGVILDAAGRSFPGRGSEGGRRGAAMVAKLDQVRQASRSMWPAVERNMDTVTGALEDVIDTVSKRINEELA
jgi:hypothetical protein